MSLERSVAAGISPAAIAHCTTSAGGAVPAWRPPSRRTSTTPGADIAPGSTTPTASARSITPAHGEAGRIWTALSREGEGGRNERSARCAPTPAGQHQLLRGRSSAFMFHHLLEPDDGRLQAKRPWSQATLWQRPWQLFLVLKREQPPSDNQRAGFPPLADVLASPPPPEIRHVRPPPLTNGHSLSTADLRSTNALTNRDAVIPGRIEVMTELSPDKDAPWCSIATTPRRRSWPFMTVPFPGRPGRWRTWRPGICT